MNTIRSQILNNRLKLPTIYDLDVTPEIQAMFRAMWHMYITKGPEAPVSMTYWAKRIADPKLHNQVLSVLSNNGWITVSTRPSNNWSEACINESKLLTYCTKDELDHTRMFYKFSKYKLQLHELDQDFGATKTSVKGRKCNTGLVRNGFAKSGKVPYSFDTNAIHANHSLVVREVNKGIEKMIVKYPKIVTDHANYRELGNEVIDAYLYADSTTQYNGGPRSSDQRGRNNRGDLSKIGNPIGFKIMRSLLVIPEQHRNVCTPAGLRNKYLFIAQLNGFKSGSTDSKAQMGRANYYARTPAHDAVEQVWLERTYADIDLAFDGKFAGIRANRATEIAKYKSANTKWHTARIPTMVDELAQLEASVISKSSHKWSCPVEIDASASVISFIGLLLNHKPYMDRCNILHGDLSDAWGHHIITNRNQAKTIMRPLYGSQISAKDMWNDMGIQYTQEEADIFQWELEHGEFAPAVAMKNFLINNAQMQPTMILNVNGHKATTVCNKFHNIGETTTKYDLFDSATKRVRRIHNTSIKQIPDLKSFKRWGPTGLIHALDSQVMDNSVDAVIDKFGWVIDIHDAMVLCAEAADYGRDVYANGRTADEPSLKQIHRDRNFILQEYFRSLNIPASALPEWKRVQAMVQPLQEPLVINPMVLK